MFLCIFDERLAKNQLKVFAHFLRQSRSLCFVPVFINLNTAPYYLVKLSNLIFLDVHTITIKVVFCSSSHQPNNLVGKQ
jgi:hypothetical protein